MDEIEANWKEKIGFDLLPCLTLTSRGGDLNAGRTI